MKLRCLEPRSFGHTTLVRCFIHAMDIGWTLQLEESHILWRVASTGNNEECQFLSHLLAFYPARFQRRFRHLKGLRIHPSTEHFHGGGSAAGSSVVINKIREWGGKGRECRWVTNNRIDENQDHRYFPQVSAKRGTVCWMNVDLWAIWVWMEQNRQTRCVRVC